MKSILKTQEINQKLLAYIRVTGPYGKGYEEPIAKLYQWAETHSLAEGESIFIYHDNPEITPNEKCRTDICIAVPQGTAVPKGIELQVLPAGSYAYIRETITEKSQYALCWDHLMSQAVKSGLALDERPCFELYFHYDLEKDIADVGFYIFGMVFRSWINRSV